MRYIIHTEDGPFMTVSVDSLCALIADVGAAMLWVEATDAEPSLGR